MQLFDYCVVTASTERQAEEFRRLIGRRLEHELYPREVEFRVYADPPAGRVGSGGGTLWALHTLMSESGATDARAFFGSRRILVLHSGGESRRLPGYAPEGKLFTPLPVPSNSTLAPIALDLQLSLFFKYPWRRGELLVGSGDVVLDFDTSSLPEDRGHVCGFAKAAPPEQATHHGVFRFDRRRETVQDYFQKAPVPYLVEHATLEGSSDCALDIGLVALSPEAASALVEFGGERVGGGTVLDALKNGTLRFDLYVELLMSALSGLSVETFHERIAGQTAMPRAAADRLFARFHPLPLRAVVARSTTFIHLGTLAEFPQACREVVQRELRPFYDEEPGEIRPAVSRDRLLVNSSGVETIVKPSGFAVFEGCHDVRIDGAEGETLFLGLEGGHVPATVPDGFCLDQRRLGEVSVLLVCSSVDTFRRPRAAEDLVFCGKPLRVWLEERALSQSDVARGDGGDLLEAALFCAGVPLEFAAGYWNVPP